MGHAASRVPEPGTYHRVLRRYDRDPRHAHQQHFVSYDVSLRAVAARMGEQVAMTLFFPKGRDASADRALRQGWIDCTEAWHHEQEQGPATEAVRAAVEALSWQDLSKLVATLVGGGNVKRPEMEARLMAHDDRQALIERLGALAA